MPLHCVICGYAQGGTTLLSQFVRQHPRIDGRFEIGCLLGDRPAAFAQLRSKLHVQIMRHWGITVEDLRESGTSRVLSFYGSSNVITILMCRNLPVRVAVSERNDPARLDTRRNGTLANTTPRKSRGQASGGVLGVQPSNPHSDPLARSVRLGPQWRHGATRGRGGHRRWRAGRRRSRPSAGHVGPLGPTRNQDHRSISVAR